MSLKKSSFDQALLAGILALSGAATAHYGLLGWMLDTPAPAASAYVEAEVAPAIPDDPALAPAPPRQTMLEAGLRESVALGSYTMETIAEFEVTGLVLGARHYATDRNADLSKVDLALAWGEMSAPARSRRLRVEQSDRFYHWKFPKGSGLTKRMVEENTGNMHMIGATPAVEATLREVGPGEVVTIRGHLVNIEAVDGWRWVSSTSRADTGAGACEVVLVSSVSRGRAA